MLRLPIIYVDNRTNIALPFTDESGNFHFDEADNITMPVVRAEAETLALMERGDALLRIYGSVRALQRDSLYIGGDLCRNCYFVLLVNGEGLELYEDFKVRKSLLYVGNIGAQRYMFLNWLRQIADNYAANTYERVLQTFIDSDPDMVWFKDSDEYHMILNKAFCEMVGKTYDECINKLHPDIWNSSPEEYASDDFVCRKTEKAVIEAGTTLEFDESVEKNGEIIQLKTYKTPLRDYYDNLIGTCGIGRDMTRALVAEHKVSTLLASIPFPILICDTDFGIQKTNSWADRLLSGFGTHIPNYKAWKDLFLCHDTLAKNTDDSVYTYMRGQEITYYSVYEEKIISPSGKHVGWLCFLIDITYERICQNIMNKAVSYDYLTDTKNRRCFYEDLSTYKGKPVCLIYFDLDHFKAVNDTYGHDAGDRLLKDCLAVLKETFGADSVYRIGGDEFTVIASAMDDSELHRRLEDVKDRIRDMDKPGVGLDVSFGISRTEALLDVDTFIRESDQMMYKAKGDRR